MGWITARIRWLAHPGFVHIYKKIVIDTEDF